MSNMHGDLSKFYLRARFLKEARVEISAAVSNKYPTFSTFFSLPNYHTPNEDECLFSSASSYLSGKKVLFLSFEESDFRYDYFIRNAFIDLCNKKDVYLDCVGYYSFRNLKEDLGLHFSPEKVLRGSEKYFRKSYDIGIVPHILDLINGGGYDTIIFHGRGYLLYSLLLSDIKPEFLRKITIFSSHEPYLFKTDARNLNILEEEYLKKKQSAERYLDNSDLLYSLPKMFAEDHFSGASRQKIIFIGGSSSRDWDMVKDIVNQILSEREDIVFVICHKEKFTSDPRCTFISEYLPFYKFVKLLRQSYLNLTVIKDPAGRYGDITNLIALSGGIPTISNTTNIFSKKYILDEKSGLIVDSSIGTFVSSILRLCDDICFYQSCQRGSMKYFLENFTTEHLVEEMYTIANNPSIPMDKDIEYIHKLLSVSGKLGWAEHEALEVYSKIKGSVVILALLGNIYNRKGDTEKAIDYLEKANGFSGGKDGNVLYDLGVSYLSLDKKKARMYLEESLKLMPENENIKNILNSIKQ